MRERERESKEREPASYSEPNAQGVRKWAKNVSRE